MHCSSKVKKKIILFSIHTRLEYFILFFLSPPSPLLLSPLSRSSHSSFLPVASFNSSTRRHRPTPLTHPKLNVTSPRPWPTLSNQAADPLRRPTPQTHLAHSRSLCSDLAVTNPQQELLLLLQLVSLSNSHFLYLTSRLPRFWIGIVDESESLWVCDINKRNIRNKH